MHCSFTAADLGTWNQAGDCSKIAFRKFKNLADSVFRRFPGKLVSAPFATASFFKSFFFTRIFQDNFQVFFGNFLADCDLVKRNIFFVLMLGEINHHAECVTSFVEIIISFPPFFICTIAAPREFMNPGAFLPIIIP